MPETGGRTVRYQALLLICVVLLLAGGLLALRERGDQEQLGRSAPSGLTPSAPPPMVELGEEPELEISPIPPEQGRRTEPWPTAEAPARIGIEADETLTGERWSALLTSVGAPFITREEVELLGLPTFDPPHPARPLLISTSGRWIGEFELTGRDRSPLELTAEELPLVRELALEYVALQDLQETLTLSIARASRDRHSTLEAAHSRVNELKSSHPEDPHGWFVVKDRGEFTVCSRRPLDESEPIAQSQEFIETLVMELGGDERIRVHGVAWSSDN